MRFKLWWTIYGRDGTHSTPYLTRIYLSPPTPWGQLYLHVFHRGDEDKDPHDHPWDFRTFPLRSYVEEVVHPVEGYTSRRVVEAGRWHRRPAWTIHRVLGFSDPGVVMPFQTQFDDLTKRMIEDGAAVLRRRLYTVVWRKRGVRKWGFWVDADGPMAALSATSDIEPPAGLVFVPWKKYVFGGSDR